LRRAGKNYLKTETKTKTRIIYKTEIHVKKTKIETKFILETNISLLSGC